VCGGGWGRDPTGSFGRQGVENRGDTRNAIGQLHKARAGLLRCGRDRACGTVNPLLLGSSYSSQQGGRMPSLCVRQPLLQLRLELGLPVDHGFSLVPARGRLCIGCGMRDIKISPQGNGISLLRIEERHGHV